LTEEQEKTERDAIFSMIESLRKIRDDGCNDWQPLTSFLANLLMDQDNPHGLLKRLTDDVKLKLAVMQKMRTTH
jgi:hypothetical protein